MSQRCVEQALGKLITDETFRAEFLRDPQRASLRAGLHLLPDEMEALARVPLRALSLLCACLDARIRRLHVPGPSRHPEITP